MFAYFLAVLGLCGALGLSLVAVSWGYSSLHCVIFSFWWLLLLQSRGSRCVGFRSCGAQAYLLSCVWNLPGPGIEPLCPALAGEFLLLYHQWSPFMNNSWINLPTTDPSFFWPIIIYKLFIHVLYLLSYSILSYC